jgi:hypothetical protein
LVGVGPAHASRALRDRLARGPLPTRIVSSGFAGALSGDIPLGAWIEAASLFAWEGSCVLVVSLSSLRLDSALACVPCDVISADHLVRCESPLPRFASGRPLAVDMESAALAREAGARGIAFSVVRLVSDTPERPLPRFVAPFTAAIAGSGPRSRAALVARGVASAIAAPFTVARFVYEGRVWTTMLRDGWTALGRRLGEVS